jgi:peptide/nickel transport system permease protein
VRRGGPTPARAGRSAMALLRFSLRRLGYAVALVLAVVVLNFLLIHLAPGDPVDTIAGSMGGMTQALRAQLTHAYGLDRPLPVQLWIYLDRVLHGNLGQSYFFNLPVSQLILERVPATLLLVTAAVLGAFLIGTFLGVLASRKPNGLLSQSITVLSVVGYSAPVFWTGIMLIILLASVVPIFPVSGMRADYGTASGLGGALDVLHHLVLPAVTLGIIYLAFYSRLTRASMLDVLGADYIRTARAKGVSELAVYYRHALRNAVLPVITVLGLQFGNVLAGAILVETVFNWPGLGRLAFDSVLRRDYPTILGLLLLSSTLVVFMNQLTDFCYRLVDPRIKTE